MNKEPKNDYKEPTSKELGKENLETALRMLDRYAQLRREKPNYRYRGFHLDIAETLLFMAENRGQEKNATKNAWEFLARYRGEEDEQMQRKAADAPQRNAPNLY